MVGWLRALTLACCLISTVAAAQTRDAAAGTSSDAVASTSAERAQADALIGEGIQLRREKRDADALQRFERAYALVPTARALAQIGLAELALSRFQAAEAHLKDALAKDDDWVRRNRRTLEGSMSAAGAYLGTVTVSSNLSGAEIWISGARAGTSPLPPQRVLAGNVLVEVRSSRGQRVERALTVASRATHHVHVEIEPAPPAVPSKTPRSRSARKAKHPSALQATSPARTAAWMLVATGALMLGEAVIAHVMRESFANDYNDDERCLYGNLSREQRCGEVLGKAKTAQTLAVAGYIGAGLAFGTAGVLFALPSTSEGSAVQPSALSVLYTGRF
jgi:hypothetical protein